MYLMMYEDKMLSSCSNACSAIGNKMFFAGLLSASLVSSADDSDSTFGVDSHMTRLDLSGADTAKAQVRSQLHNSVNEGDIVKLSAVL